MDLARPVVRAHCFILCWCTRVQFAKQLLAKNNHVFATARSADTGSLQSLAKQSSKLTLGEVDTTNEHSIQAWVDSVKAETSKLDVRSETKVSNT